LCVFIYRFSCLAGSKFLARAYKVGKVEQAETALGAEMRIAASKSAKGNPGEDQGKIVRRELNKVFTIGTLTDLNLLNDDHASHCVSLYEQASDGDGALSQFGITILDAATCAISIGAWSDDVCRSNLETVVRQLRVKEFLHIEVSCQTPSGASEQAEV
jgi:DNA mismatch repair protein MSH6